MIIYLANFTAFVAVFPQRRKHVHSISRSRRLDGGHRAGNGRRMFARHPPLNVGTTDVGGRRRNGGRRTRGGLDTTFADFRGGHPRVEREGD